MVNSQLLHCLHESSMQVRYPIHLSLLFIGQKTFPYQNKDDPIIARKIESLSWWLVLFLISSKFSWNNIQIGNPWFLGISLNLKTIQWLQHNCIHVDPCSLIDLMLISLNYNYALFSLLNGMVNSTLLCNQFVIMS